jgi:type IV fimbrial biogenesis protein FimU
MEDLFVALDGEKPMRRGFTGEDMAEPVRQTRSAGFTLIELLVTLAIVIIVVAMAIPLIGSAVAQFRMNSAVLSVTGIIQATRYRAISAGVPFRVSFKSAALTYQLQSFDTVNNTWNSVGNAVPFAGAAVNPVLNADITLQFRPNGVVSATTGVLPMTLTGNNRIKTINVGTYGYINVTCALQSHPSQPSTC